MRLAAEARTASDPRCCGGSAPPALDGVRTSVGACGGVPAVDGDAPPAAVTDPVELAREGAEAADGGGGGGGRDGSAALTPNMAAAALAAGCEPPKVAT